MIWFWGHSGMGLGPKLKLCYCGINRELSPRQMGEDTVRQVKCKGGLCEGLDVMGLWFRNMRIGVREAFVDSYLKSP